MTRNVRAVFWLAGALAVVLAAVVGPLVAAFALAGASLAIIAVLMGMRAARVIGEWRLEHPWRFRRGRPASTPAAREERRAA
jgi:hypothetical protein